mmetsp:Transcript_36483/g.117145  ORF Transcript_36483/g.117145 Transcript_36483/m.117145 type:complete len:264 (-) Transcript_36483:293-1084(-)
MSPPPSWATTRGSSPTTTSNRASRKRRAPPTSSDPPASVSSARPCQTWSPIRSGWSRRTARPLQCPRPISGRPFPSLRPTGCKGCCCEGSEQRRHLPAPGMCLSTHTHANARRSCIVPIRCSALSFSPSALHPCDRPPRCSPTVFTHSPAPTPLLPGAHQRYFGHAVHGALEGDRPRARQAADRHGQGQSRLGTHASSQQLRPGASSEGRRPQLITGGCLGVHGRRRTRTRWVAVGVYRGLYGGTSCSAMQRARYSFSTHIAQ